MRMIKCECTKEGYDIMMDLIETYKRSVGECVCEDIKADECSNYRNCGECLQDHFIFEIVEEIK